MKKGAAYATYILAGRPDPVRRRGSRDGGWPQFITFVVLSAISMALLRPIARKLLKPNYSATNADRVLGTTGLVTEEINNIAGKGLVNLSGQVWSARSSQADGVIPAGQEVRVLKIQGVKVIVEPV